MDGVKVMLKLKDLITVNETIELIKKDNPKYKARLHQVKVAFRLAKVKLTNIKPIKARKGVVPKGHYDKSGDRLAAAWAITATDGKNTKSGELVFQDGNDPGFYIDKDYMGLNVNSKNRIPRNIQRWMIGKKAHHSKGVDESINEAIKPQGYSQLNTMAKHAGIYLRDLSKALRKQDDDAVLREVHFLAAQFTTMEKMLKDKKWNAKYNESITINGKKYKPLNENDQSWAKYYSWRNDKSMTPKQKIGMSMREVRDSLQELEKIVFRSIKLKKELKVGSDNYWKSTHSALRRIHERLVKLTGKIANLY